MQQDLSRAQLLDAAEEVFGRKGFHEATLKEVAELAEFSVGSVYSFFESKDDLFRQIFLRRGEEFMPAMRALLEPDGGDPVQQLHALVDFQVGFFRRHPRFGRLFLRYSSATMPSADREVDVVMGERYDEAMRLQAELFGRGQAAGAFRPGDPEVLSRLFSGVISAYQALDPAVVSDDDGAVERLPLDDLHDLVARVRRRRRGRGVKGSPPEGDWLGTPYLRFERHGPLAHVVVDRPDARNALTPAMYFGIRYAVEHVERDDGLHGLLLTGTGDVFMPGGDPWSNDDGWADLPTLLGMDNTPFDAVRRSRKPVVAAVNGICQGGGLVIAMLSDVAVASDRATFRAPELFRGIADTNYAQVLPRQIGPARARDMLMTGRAVSAEEALAWGLVARVVAHESLLASAVEVLEQCCRTAPGARAAVKRVLHEYYGTYDRMGMDESLAGPEPDEGWAAFREKRSPSWVPEALRKDGRLWSRTPTSAPPARRGGRRRWRPTGR